MKKYFATISFFLLTGFGAQSQTATTPILTKWSEAKSATIPLPEYPRPQMVRENWKNLNGQWDYTILPVSETMPTSFQGKITVPYPVESYLSGVQKRVGKDSVLWYKLNTTISSAKNSKTILHFGAVDWSCTVFINGEEAGRHKGGYDPFSIDITPHLKKNKQQEIIIGVWDPADDGPQPRGKQVKKPEGIWYTPVTGIWQTVWLETVPETYIVSTKQTPNLDASTVELTTDVENAKEDDEILITLFDGSTKLMEQKEKPGEVAVLQIPNPKTWSPQSPFLYDITYTLLRKGKKMDEVKSYFGMRKISMQADKKGIQRMLLNNEFVFQYGPLDQGWWPDGLYTAPTDDALKYDVEQTKAMGFNMIRKHVKAEPARWYYHCDKLGILVWQDMPSGDLGNKWEMRPGIYGKATDKDRTPESESYYKNEWVGIMKSLYNFPCIVVWVPFNEAWGQYKTDDIVKLTAAYDSTRLINAASGGNFSFAGDITDLHNYPEPLMPDPELFGDRHILVLGEFGGLGLPVQGHTWQQKDNWGYQTFKNETELFAKYEEFINSIPKFIEKGLSAAVYTQTTDVEVETNGIMTYDRKVTKMPVDKLKALHQQLYDPKLVHIK